LDGDLGHSGGLENSREGYIDLERPFFHLDDRGRSGAQLVGRRLVLRLCHRFLWRFFLDRCGGATGGDHDHVCQEEHQNHQTSPPRTLHRIPLPRPAECHSRSPDGVTQPPLIDRRQPSHQMGRLAAIDQRGLGHAIRGSGMTFRGTGKRYSMKGARRRCLVVLMFLLANVVVIATGRATAPVQEKPPEKPVAKSKDEPSADKLSTAAPTIVKVEKGPFKVDVTLTGVFESARMSEVAVKPKAWSMPLVVEKAAELGMPVKRGDILVELDREKIDKAIQDAEVELSLGELSLKHAEEELPVLEKLLPIDLAAAERAKTQADEDLSRFLEIDR